jgi:hypothetical protein
VISGSIACRIGADYSIEISVEKGKTRGVIAIPGRICTAAGERWSTPPVFEPGHYVVTVSPTLSRLNGFFFATGIYGATTATVHLRK